MKIAVAGLWHLGSVTAACLADAGHDVLGFDPDAKNIASLNTDKAPVFEPALDALIAKGRTAGKLSFSANRRDVADADFIWVTFDTPVDDDDVADVDAVKSEVCALFPYLKANCLIIISSQLPVGSTRELLDRCTREFPEKNIAFACSPENLRLGKAIGVFSNPDRVVVGVQQESDKQRIGELLAPITKSIVWMSIESAEMTKHALNAFLATSVVFINELSTICEQVGADAREVERGLKSEERIGPKAYLRPGGAIAGGTLARDVNYLIQTGAKHDVTTPLFASLLESNQHHKQWSCNRMQEILQDLRHKKITALGLTYKVGTDTLRRSSAVETCEWLNSQGANVSAYDPVVKQLPEHLRDVISLKETLEDALRDADAIVVAAEWPQFAAMTIDQLLSMVKQPRIFDAGGFLMKIFGGDKRIQYYTVGSKA